MSKSGFDFGSFYRNLADNVDDVVGSNFYSQISSDSNINNEDVQKYILATDINHYVTKDKINNASFRQKLYPISKNIIRRQNPIELVFEDVSTFDAENPIVGSLLRETYLNKKQTDSDFIKSIPSHSGKEFEIKIRLDRLRDLKRLNTNNNNHNINNNNNNNSRNLFPPDPPGPNNRNLGQVPEAPTI